VSEFEIAPDAPAEFVRAASSLLTAQVRAEVSVDTIPSPTRIAPHSVAISGEVLASGNSESLHGTGRLILMHDPEQIAAWGGAFRIVCFAQAPLDAEIALDSLLSEVTWSWLTDALAASDAPYTNASGTATRVLSQGFGELADQGESAHIELRASWSPDGDDMSGHVRAWATLLCMLAGLPPTAEAVSIDAHKRERG
jgi:hypothetical protein